MTYLQTVKKIMCYFPIRFSLTGLFFACVLLSNSSIQTVENQILSDMLNFLHIPVYVNSDLVVGNMYAPVHFSSPIQTQILFLIFFISLAVCTRSTFTIRAKMLYFGALCFGAFILTQFSIIAGMLALGFTSNMAFLQASTVFTGIVGSLFIEMSLFSAIKLPERTQVPKMVTRNYIDEYAILAILLVGASLLVYFIINILNLQSNSPLTAYLALNLSTILYLRYYLAYFIYEVKTPAWVRSHISQSNLQPFDVPISFLLPAYNEEKHIQRCIESIDKASSKYIGSTEIIVINDGSTDGTKKISSEAVLGLKNASGKVYNIPNSGKGFALQYGLERIKGDVVFRIDTDSFIDENAISRVMNHFKDPLVGSVSGLIMPLEEKSWIQKIWVLHYALLTFYKRGWELIDSVLVQPGAFSVFRTSSLKKVGGWADDILGEDSDIAVKLARCGYRNEYEQHAVVFSDIPSNLRDLREQRLRWSMSFYHARSAHLDTIKDFNGPISIMYSLNIVEHGLGYANALFVPFLLATFLTGYNNSLLALASLVGISTGLLAIEFVTYGLQSLVYAYFLVKFKKIYIIKYIPMMRLYSLIYSVFIETEGIEILLSVTSKWKQKHTKELTASLRKKIKEGVGAV